MTGLFNRSEKTKKAIEAQSKRRNTTKSMRDNITKKLKKENEEITKKRIKRRKETTY